MAAVGVGRAHVLTISDRCFAGETLDRSGPSVVRMLGQAGFAVGSPEVLPDNREQIIDALLAAVGAGFDLVVTTGGTGLGPRDLTPQATASIVDYEVPGLGEQMRRVGMTLTPMAMLSRGTAGVREKTLIVNLPGSQAGAVQSLEAVLPAVGHAVQLLQGQTDQHPVA